MIKILFQLAGISILFALTAGLADANTPETGSDNSLHWKLVRRIQFPAEARDVVYSLDGKYVFALMADQRVLVYDRGDTLLGSIPVGAGVSAIDLAPQGQLLYLVDTENNVTSTLMIDFVVAIDITDSAFKGPVDAPVTIVVFSDFQ